MHMPIFRGRLAAHRSVANLPDSIGVAGALAGLGGGIAMALIGALLTHALDQDLWLQLKVIGSLVLGPTAARLSGFAAGPVVLGALIHLLVAALLGVLFELLMRRFARLSCDYGIPDVVGLAYGLLIWVIAFFIAIPIASPLLLQIYEPALIIQHLVYGAITGLLYSTLRPQPYASMASA